MVTIIANQLDSNYSQTQINAFYTQCKKLLVNPFDFYAFINEDEYKLLESTHKKEGYLQGINFHVPKYGKDWIEIDIMQHTQPGEKSIFITPNVILNDPKSFFTYKTKGIDKLYLEDGNLAYFCHRNEKVENILTKWNDMEDQMTFENHSFEGAFYSNVVPELPFIQNTNHNYPEKTEGDIVVLPYWYEDFTKEQLELNYNRETDLYPWLPERVQMEVSDNEGNNLTAEQIEDSFNLDFITKAKIKRVKMDGLEGDPINNPELFDICQYLMGNWGIAVDIITEGKTNDLVWWTNLSLLFVEITKNIGNITFNIDTSNPGKDILDRAKVLIDGGARVFWNYTQTHLSQEADVLKAKELSEEYNFTGFVYNNEVVEETKPIEKEVKKEMPDYNLISLDTLKTVKQDDIYTERKIKFSPHVHCEGKVNNQFYLSATGNVFPCKHVALNLITAHNSPEHKTELMYSWDKNSISKHTLEDIFTNDFYKGYFNNLLKLNPLVIHNEQDGIC